MDDSAIKKTISRGVAWVGVATSVVAVLDRRARPDLTPTCIRLLTSGLSAPLRLVSIGGTVIVVSFVLLGTFEQYSPRAIIRALRG